MIASYSITSFAFYKAAIYYDDTEAATGKISLLNH